MNEKQRYVLGARNTDVDGVLKRLSGNEGLYTVLLRSFLEDPTVEQLNTAVREFSWDDAFTAAHALKGVAGNMGFVPLMHSTAQLIVLLRRGSLKEIPGGVELVNSSYRDITDAIHQYLDYEENQDKGRA